jgi:hypothetical protein
MINTENWIAQLEDESKALKQGFDRAASNMTVFTKSISITTTKNDITITESGGFSNVSSNQERVIVTFATNNGSNTIAKLEVETSGTSLPIKRLRTYSGGAQWVITNDPSRDGNYNWLPTTYTFTVQSFLDGSLSVAEATS